MSCISPMSAKTPSNTGSALPASTGIGRPHWCMTARSPVVFSAAVLPPMFGPVTTSPDHPGPTCTLTGTASPPSSGCLAWARRMVSPLPSTARAAASRRAPYLARAMMKSSRVAASTPDSISAADSPTAADSSHSTRSVSRSSSRTSSRQRFPISTVAKGSTNSVAPVFDAPCTTPGTLWR